MQNVERIVSLSQFEVRRLLSEQNLKHYWVADQIGVHKTTLRRWLNGRTRRVPANRVSSLASLLGVSLTTLCATPSS